MTLIDALIVILVVGAIFRGLEEGFVHQFFSTLGFFFGLAVGAAVLEPRLINLVHTPLSRLVVTLAATLGCAFLFLFFGEVVGIMTKRKLSLQEIVNRADDVLGAVLASVAMLALVWLSAAVIVQLPYTALQSEVKGSALVRLLNHGLPQTPDIIADIGHFLAPNGFPNVFSGDEPAPVPVTLPTPEILAAAVKKDQPSVVRIEGIGCGGRVTGSGFIVGQNLVATNAHVVAGIRAPAVIDSTGTHRATAIWFDPSLDFAVLRVSGLTGAPLPLDVNIAKRGTPAGVLGYPGGGPFTAGQAAILDEFTARGKNIYNVGHTERDVYSIQADVIPGNSGGPLVDTDGDVIGIVFASSTNYSHTGYALTLSAVVSEINSARANSQAVNTGSCAE